MPEKRIIGQNEKPEVSIHRLEKINIDPAEIGKLLGKKGIADDDLREKVEKFLEESKLPPGLKELAGNVKQEPTEANLEAKAKLDELVSSTGIKYSDAEQTINDIRAKYTDDKYFSKKIVDPNTKRHAGSDFAIYYKPYEVKQFNPIKLPEPARTQYFEALDCVKEIQEKNSALVKLADLPFIQEPPTNYYTGGVTFL